METKAGEASAVRLHTQRQRRFQRVQTIDEFDYSAFYERFMVCLRSVDRANGCKSRKHFCSAPIAAQTTSSKCCRFGRSDALQRATQLSYSRFRRSSTRRRAPRRAPSSRSRRTPTPLFSSSTPRILAKVSTSSSKSTTVARSSGASVLVLGSILCATRPLKRSSSTSSLQTPPPPREPHFLFQRDESRPNRFLAAITGFMFAPGAVRKNNNRRL